MVESYYRFRFRRIWRRNRRRLAWLWRRLTKLFRFYILNRALRLRRVERFVLGVTAVLVLTVISLVAQIRSLPEYYQVDGPQVGGIFVEGAVGNITRINPLFPEEPSAEVATKLIFNGLTRYNGQGQIEPDLAEGWQANEAGTEYSVTLRDNIYWHDGKKVTAEDVVFTIKTIQHPDTRSPLNGNWQGIEVTAVDQRTVLFKLPAAYSPFVNLLTTPLVPAHILSGIVPAQLRIADFNQRPIGTGPFIFSEFIGTQKFIVLRPNNSYVHGAPLLGRFVIRTYDDEQDLLKAFRNKEITAASGFGQLIADEFEEVAETRLHEWPIANQAYAFFNNEQPITADVKVRRALTRATQFNAAAEKLAFRFKTADAPILPEHLGYNPSFTQFQYDPTAAAAELDAAGWVMGADGIRTKDGQRLQLQLVTQNSDTYPTLAQLLQEQWRKVGVDLQVQLLEAEDLRQQYLRPRKYDVILLGISLGADPDVYSYWHSSQEKDPGLNLSRYRSKAADADLEAGRNRLDIKLRAAKYERFMQTWRDDAPAIAAYRPDFLYAVRGRVFGLAVDRLITPTDRFFNVEDWSVNTQQRLQRENN